VSKLLSNKIFTPITIGKNPAGTEKCKKTIDPAHYLNLIIMVRLSYSE
jgi:hypothetical protein